MTAKFGQNEKERILKLAAGVGNDAEDSNPLQSTSNVEQTEALAALKRGSTFFAAVPVSALPIAPFINRAKLPRVLRQKTLDKLSGQHLALAALKEALGDDPAGAAADEQLRNGAFAQAIQQEADIYQRCSSAQVYQNLASRATALDWHKAVAEAAYGETLAKEESNKKAEEMAAKEKEANIARQQRKRQTPSPIAQPEQKNKPLESAQGKKKVEPAPLLEAADLEWGEAKAEGDAAAEESRQWVRRRVVTAMEDVLKCKDLSAEERVYIANRCCEKVLQRLGVEGVGSRHQQAAPAALKKLIKEYSEYLIRKRDDGSGGGHLR